MKFGKKHLQQDAPEPVGVEALAASTTEDDKATGATTQLPEGVPDLTVLPADPTHAAGAAAGHAANPYATDAPTLDPEEQEAYDQLKRIRKERRHKKLIRRGIALGIVAVLAGGVAIWRFATPQQDVGETQVITQPVYRAPFTSEVTGTGSIKPASSRVIVPQVEGTIESVNVVAGQHVEEGDVLFTIKNDDLDRAVTEAERGVRKAKQDVSQAQRALAQAKEARDNPTLATATASADSGASLLDGGGFDDAPATDAQVNTQELEDAVLNAQSSLEDAQMGLEQANESYDQAVEQAAQRTVKAPISGSILTLNAQVGASASGGGQDAGQLCQIADLSQMTVTVQVNEADINKVQVDQHATATFSAAPDAVLDATVRSVASTNSGDSASMNYGYGSGGVSYDVELVIPEPDERLKPGMTANVSIVTQSIDSALVVPTFGVTDYGDGTGSILVEDDAETHTAHVVAVNILASNGSETAVEPAEGATLEEGASVIVSGAEAATITDEGAGADYPADATDAQGGTVTLNDDVMDAAPDDASASSGDGEVVEHGVNGAGEPVA